MNIFGYIDESLKRGLVSIVRRRILWISMIVVPIFTAFFFLDLMKQGVPNQAPVGIIDLDNSSTSRSIVRTLSAMKEVSIRDEYISYHEAVDALQEGKILGFFFIPSDLEERALGGRQPRVSFYINYAYYAPASFQYRGFKTISVLANAAIARTLMRTLGLSDRQVMATLQPITIHTHGLNNPWTNYSYYLNLSFIPCFLALMILLVTAFSIGTELKYGTSKQWIESSANSIELAVAAKMMPQTIIFTAVGWFIQFLMYRVYGLPLNCNPWHMILAMAIFVVANQGFGLFLMCVVPNFRLGTTLCSLFGVISFSFCGFSLPSESLYPWVKALSYVVPVRYYFLLSIDQALNGLPLYYSRISYAAMLGFTLLPWTLLWRLRRFCVNPVYVP